MWLTPTLLEQHQIGVNVINWVDPELGQWLGHHKRPPSYQQFSPAERGAHRGVDLRWRPSCMDDQGKTLDFARQVMACEFEQLPDGRRGKNPHYRTADAVIRVRVFFMQCVVPEQQRAEQHQGATTCSRFSAHMTFPVTSTSYEMSGMKGTWNGMEETDKDEWTGMEWKWNGMEWNGQPAGVKCCLRW